MGWTCREATGRVKIFFLERVLGNVGLETQIATEDNIKINLTKMCCEDGEVNKTGLRLRPLAVVLSVLNFLVLLPYS